jgi:GSH-dependent disulfide-bond oxidoreductase
MAPPIELYFWPTPNGWKIAIALEEMELPYALKPVNIGKGEQFGAAFMAISPSNRMPAIVDPEGPDGQPISVFESGAILQYLGRKSGKFYPREERARVDVEQWLIWQVAGLGPMAGQASHFINYAPRLVDDPAKIEYARIRYINELNRLYGVMERRLADRPYLAGDYSIADMASWPWTRGAHRLGQTWDDFPRLKDWVERVKSRPAVERALAKGETVRARAVEQRTPEALEEQARILFGQTAKSVADACAEQRSKQG